MLDPKHLGARGSAHGGTLSRIVRPRDPTPFAPRAARPLSAPARGCGDDALHTEGFTSGCTLVLTWGEVHRSLPLRGDPLSEPSSVLRNLRLVAADRQIIVQLFANAGSRTRAAAPEGWTGRW